MRAARLFEPRCIFVPIIHSPSKWDRTASTLTLLHGRFDHTDVLGWGGREWRGSTPRRRPTRASPVNPSSDKPGGSGTATAAVAMDTASTAPTSASELADI